MKVLYFTNLPVPYRMEFFNELGKYCDLSVWMETEQRRKSNSNWLAAHKVETYTYKVLKQKLFGNKFINYHYSRDLNKEKFDIIVVGTYYSISAMIFIEVLRRKRMPYILSSDGGFIKQDNILKKMFKKHFIKGALAYLSTGKMTNDYLVHYGADKNKLYLYHFTSQRKEDFIIHIPSIEEKKEKRTTLNIEEEYMLLSVGAYIYRKGYDVLLNAAELLPNNIGIYIIGGKNTDDCNESLKKYKNEHNLAHVHFIDFLSKAELKEYYLAADAFVLPTREDIWGLVINEAMSYALPVITTNKCIAGVELINKKVGRIIEANSFMELKQAILEVLLNDERYNMGKEAFITNSEYTIENMAKDHINLFNDILDTWYVGL